MVAQVRQALLSGNQLVSSWTGQEEKVQGARITQPGTQAFSLVTRHGSPFTVPPVLETAERL